MIKIIIFEIDTFLKGNNGQKIEQILNYLICWTQRDWKEVAKEEFKNFAPGSKKMVRVFHENKIIYEYKNY